MSALCPSLRGLRACLQQSHRLKDLIGYRASSNSILNLILIMRSSEVYLQQRHVALDHI